MNKKTLFSRLLGSSAAAFAATAIPSMAAPFTWSQNTAATQTWTTAGNWVSSAPFVSAPANELIFFANTTTALAAGANNITGSVPATLSMNTLTLNGRGTATSGSSTTISIAGSGSAWTIGDGTTSTVNLNGLHNVSNGTTQSGLTLNYNVAANLLLNQATTTFTGNGTAGFTFSGNIGEAAAGHAITKAGSSILTFSGTNSYTGGTSVTGGGVVFRTLASKSASGTHSFAAGTTLGLGVGGSGFTAGDLDNAFAGSMTGNLSGITLSSTANVGIDTTAGNFAYSTSIAGSPANGLVKLGANTLTLTGSSTYTGATTVLGGTLSASTLADGGVASSIGAAPSGAAGLVLNGGTLSYTGATTATNRGFTQVGNTNSTINVAGAGVALTMGASTITNLEALNITGGAGSSLTTGPLTVLATATQANFNTAIPTTVGNMSYAYSAGQFTTASRGAAAITYGNITGPGTTQALFLGGSSTITVNGAVSGFTGNFIIGAGGQTVKLLGLSTFTGTVDIRQATTVEFNSIKNVGGGASALGAPATGTGTILFGQVGNAQTLRYTGTGDTTDRELNLNGTTANVTLEQAGTGLLKFTRALGATGLGSKTLVLAGSTAGTGELAGAIKDNSTTNKTSVSKTGTGTWTLSGVNTYTGSTAVTGGGTLAITGTGSINTTSGISITSSTLRYSSSTNLTAPVTFTSGTLAGTNWNGTLSGQSIGTGKTVSPGSSPGLATTGGQTWASGGTYLWEVNDAAGTAGSATGWDVISGSGALDITSSTASPFAINVVSLTLADSPGNAANFTDTTSYNWLLADFSSITGFSADKFALSLTGFANPHTGTFAIALGDTVSGGDNSQLYLTYTAVPEPSLAGLAALGGLAFLRRRRVQPVR